MLENFLYDFLLLYDADCFHLVLPIKTYKGIHFINFFIKRAQLFLNSSDDPSGSRIVGISEEDLSLYKAGDKSFIFL